MVLTSYNLIKWCADMKSRFHMNKSIELSDTNVKHVISSNTLISSKLVKPGSLASGVQFVHVMEALMISINYHSVSMPCLTFISSLLPIIWDEVGEFDVERDKMLLDLQRECLEVYKRNVDSTNRSRAQLRQAIADSKAELAAICSAMWERPVHIRQWSGYGQILRRNLNPEVEEGICQVLSYMWLESKIMPGLKNMPSSSSSSSSSSSKKDGISRMENKLDEFFMHQIAHDASPACGGGFRAANAAANTYDLRDLDALESFLSSPPLSPGTI
ncbi:Protein of unknown function DUF3633 [Cynara cardunculus var. scolymus]|uniref:Protein DA1-like domain-containing protein n=1 Tax=Cynara cardunculus var. scolymus TaxID=59895 RepID=A0A103YLY0_CYNCS|nr:Protein of unknown function DUF3633 [Cynara cardunculus var. scolymus]